MSKRLIAPIVDLQNLAWFRARRPPPIAAVEAVKQSLASASVWRIRNHGVPAATIDDLRFAGRQFFDQPAARKKRYCVGENMDRSRGWELYPQHWRYHEAALKESNDEFRDHAEPSTREGILCERFVCGPPTICSEPHRPPHSFYDSAFARVFYESNVWPDEEHPALRPAMEQAYEQLEPVAAASLQCLASAAGLRFDAFDHLVASDSAEYPDAPLRHHSRLQLNNYPSQPRVGRRRQLPPIRASRHLDTALLSVLCREPSVEGGEITAADGSVVPAVAPGRSGALEVQLHGCPDHLDDASWACVPASEGELTCFVGSLAPVLTGFKIRPTTHRVSNPCPEVAADSRRMSLGFVLKPDYTAPALGLAAAAAPAPEQQVPCVGLVGRVGWQNHAMQTTGITRPEAVAAFKPWKNAAMSRLRDIARS